MQRALFGFPVVREQVLEKITDELSLTGRESLASAERIQERETVSYEHRTENLRRIFDPQIERATV